MKCRNCDYSLWEIRTRDCPECGTPFAPSQQEFVPNSVRFCCPHCDQTYYGTDQRGHLEPPQFVCTRCGQEIAMDEMVLRPAEGVDETRTRVDTMPWLERGERGLVRAWLATISAGMTRPNRLVRGVPLDSPVSRAFIFMAGSNFVFLAVGQLLPVVFALGVLSFFVGGRAAPLTGMPGPLLMYPLLVQVPIIVATAAVAPALWWLCAHGLLVLFRGASAPLSRTGHAIFYSVGPHWLKAIPCDCTGVAGWIWWMVSATLMVQEVHRCPGGRATAAVVISSVVTNGVVIMAAVVVAVAPMGVFAQLSAQQAGAAVAPAAMSVRSVAQQHGGLGPRHATMLIIEGGLDPASFVRGDSLTTLDLVPLGDSTLQEFLLLPPNRQRLEADAAAIMMPEGVVAHRLGDLVFTYHGANLAAADPQLWTVVAWPDPAVNPPPGGDDVIGIGLADGTTITVRGAAFATSLAEQNRYRATLGLPPLPDPSQITHDRPAVADR